MTDKPDPYQILGVAKNATKDQIKEAHKRIIMRTHPDMVKNKKYASEAEKQKAVDAAALLFKQATEAEKILSDDKLRMAYDQFGHKGVENALAGKNASSGQSYTDAAGKLTVKKHYTEDDLMDFFGKSKERREREEAKDDGLTAEQRRQRAYEERMARRNGGKPPATSSSTVTPEPEKGSAANAFHVVAEKVSEATQKLKDGVEVPLTALEKFRDNLADFLGEVDKAINKAKGPGPRFG